MTSKKVKKINFVLWLIAVGYLYVASAALGKGIFNFDYLPISLLASAMSILSNCIRLFFRSSETAFLEKDKAEIPCYQ